MESLNKKLVFVYAGTARALGPLLATKNAGKIRVECRCDEWCVHEIAPVSRWWAALDCAGLVIACGWLMWLVYKISA